MNIGHHLIIVVAVVCMILPIWLRLYSLSWTCNNLNSNNPNTTTPTPTMKSYYHEIEPNQCTSHNEVVYDKFYRTEGKLRSPEQFYSEADWPPKDIIQTSASGVGSNRGYMTVASLRILKDAIMKFSVKSMLDVPCGDVNWILDSIVTDTLPLYVGLDGASSVIEVNKKRFAHHNNKRFEFWDATECIFPRFINGTTNTEQVFDLVHIRDVIQHLTLDQGLKYFCNAFLSGVKVLVTTSHDGEWRGDKLGNIDIEEGGYYDANLFSEPFSFPEGNCTRHDKRERRAFTCVFDLTNSDWKEYISSKCFKA